MPERATTAGRTVAFFVNGIGDHILALPALRALCAHVPGELELLCNRRYAGLFFAELPVRALHPHEFTYTQGGRTFDAQAVAAELAPCELFLSLNPWHSAAVDELLERLRPRRSIGFFPAYDLQLARDYTRHSAELAFSVVHALDPALRFEDFAAPPEALPAHRNAARAIVDRLPHELRILLVHADTKPEKMWPPERVTAALDRFLERRPDFVALVVGETPLALDRGRRADAIVGCERLPLGTSLALAAQADLFFGIDSCMLHAADLFRVPSVALFGPTEPHEFGCRFAPARHVVAGGAMSRIEVADAAGALDAMAAAWCTGTPRRFAVAPSCATEAS